ncbi:MAG TPA: HAMP domain-containing sensor histidine kinase [Gaiellaceae bacterium]|nr:HAMP domain-containing sensor histidine kinase [Gaiellaceae bacterium]
MSFRARLVLAAAYLLAAVVIALTVPLALNVDRRATSELESDVVADATLLSGRVANLVRIGATDRLAAVAGEATVGDGARTVIVNGNGIVLADSDGAAPAGVPFATAERPELGAALGGSVDVRQRHSDTLGEELLLVTVPVTDRGDVIGALRVSAPMGEVESSVRSSWLALALIGLAVVGAGLVLAWILAGSIAKPVEKLRAAAGRLGRGDLDARVEPEGPREIDELGRSFNRMAGELSSNLAAQRDFVANASHQLRTPLTGIKLRLEAIRAEGGTAAEQAAKAEAELDRLSGLVGDLLALARAAADQAPGEAVDLGEAVRAAARRWAEPAAEAGHELAVAGGQGGQIWAAPRDVADILDNLLENAVRYSPAGSRIEVGLDRNGGRPGFVVADTGPGIPPEERARVFERFYRGARGTSAGPGTGLGLAIVAELAERWNGSVELLDGPGTRVRASFPPAADSSPSLDRS